MKKILLVVLDGLGDEPIPDLDDQTPLQAADTPYMDCLAQEGKLGLAESDFRGALPTSEEGHFQLFGYDPQELGLRRGIVTVAGAGIEVQPGDVALRANFAHVKDGKAVDRRAGRIRDTKELIAALRKIKVEGAEFLIKSAKEHRLGIVIRGQGLSGKVSDSDPFYTDLDTEVRRVKPLDDTPEAKKTAEILNQFLDKANQVLKEHSLNKQREEKGKPPANYILTRGASSVKQLTPFQQKYGLKPACVAGKVLYKQVARMLGMKIIKVEGADGTPKTNLDGKVTAVNKALTEYDFVFFHIKATDSLAEDGKYMEKKKFIEKIDQELKILDKPEDTTICITCDHSTCSLLKRHCDQPCPVLIWGQGSDQTEKFSEEECEEGELGKFKQLDLMSFLIDSVN
jgi:2,3-bisphosphoglycerate-independent phosphoglycerate mutase